MASQAKSQRHRGWQFTLNNYTPEEEAFLKERLDCSYIQFGYEIAPTTRTPHLQGYVKFENKKSLKQVKSLISRAHLEPARDEVALINYNEKDVKCFERGIRPKTPSEKAQTTNDRYRQAIEQAKDGQFDDIEPDLYLRYYNTLKYIHRDHMKPPSVMGGELTHEWIYGPPGSGKTKYVFDTYDIDNLYIKNAKTKWWDGYNGQDIVLIDDFDMECVHQGHYLKVWADRYPFNCEVKGGSRLIRPKKIIVTSNYMIGQLFFDPAMAAAINRRFKSIHMTTD